MSGSATGHIVIRRQAKDGKDGQDGAKGAKVRWRTYKAGEAYLSGATGEEYYDLAFHATYQQFFVCIQSYPASETHSPTLSGSNAYWEYQPGLDNLFVDILCANEAFLNQLKVRHLDGATGIFSGSLVTQFQNVADVITPSNSRYTLSPSYQNYRVTLDLQWSGSYEITIILPMTDAVLPGMCMNIFVENAITKSDPVTYIMVGQNQENRGIVTNDMSGGISSYMGAELPGLATAGGFFQFMAIKRSSGSFCSWVLLNYLGDVTWLEE